MPENSTKPADEARMLKNKSKKGAYVHKHFVKQKFSDLPEEVRRSIQTSTINSREGNMRRERTKSSFRQASKSSVNFNPRNKYDTIDSNDYYVPVRNTNANADLSPRIKFQEPEVAPLKESPGLRKSATRKWEQSDSTVSRRNLFKDKGLNRSKTSTIFKENSQSNNNEYNAIDKKSVKNTGTSKQSPRSISNSASKISIKSKFLRDMENKTKNSQFRNTRGSLQILDSVISNQRGSLV